MRLSSRQLLGGWALLTVLFLSGFGCTRVAEQTSTIKIDLGSQAKSSLSTEEIFYVSFNISGPKIGKSPIIRTWDLHSDQGARPEAYDETLPKGQTLFQYLAVARSNSTGALIFYYGDAEKNLQAESESVQIVLSAIGGGSATEGRLAGRIMNSSGLTGKVAMKFSPPTGKPAMVVLYEHIFGGWVTDFIVIDHPDAAFDYVLVDSSGSEIGAPFISKLKPSSPMLIPSGSVAKIKVPPSMRVFGVGDNEPNAEQHIFFGFFGSTTQKACYSTATEPIPDLFTLDGSTPINWAGAGPTSLQAGIVGGGVPVGSCNGTAFEQTLTYKHLGLAHQEDLGFEGPYKRHPQADPYSLYKTSWNENTSSLTIEWDYLPGVLAPAPNGLTGTAVYFHSDFAGASNNEVLDEESPSFNCQSLKDEKGFTKHLVESGVNSKTFTGVTRAKLENNLVKILLCPYRGSEQFSMGLETHDFWHLTEPRPVLRIIGGDTNTPYIDTNNFLTVPGLRLRKSAVTNSYHRLVGSFRQGYLPASDVTYFKFSIDGGSTWTQIGANNPSEVTQAMGIAGVPLSHATFTSLIGPITDDVSVQFKMKLAKPNNYGPQIPDEILSEPVTLVGENSCSNPTLKIKRVEDGTLYTGSDFLNDFLDNVSNATSLTHSYKLVWEGGSCTDIVAAFEFLNVGSQNCLNFPEDIHFDPSRPFTFSVDPKDSLGMDCSLGAATISLGTPSSGSDFISRDVSGQILTHSTLWQGLVPLLTATTLGEPGDFNLNIKKWVTSAAQNLTGQFFKANDDKKLIAFNSSSLASNVAWNPVKGSHFATPTGSDSFFDISASSTSTVGPHFQSVSSSAKTGGFITAVHGYNNKEITYISDRFIWGYSPLFITDDGGNNHSLHFLMSNSSSFEATGMKSFSTSGTGTTFSSQVRALPLSNSGEDSDSEKIVLYSGDKIYFAAIEHSTPHNVSWSGEVTLAAGATALGSVDYGSVLKVFTKDPGNIINVVDVSIPEYQGAGAWDAASAYSPSNTKNNINAIDFMQCGDGSYAVIGRDPGDPSIAKVEIFDSSGFSINSGSSSTGSLDSSDVYNRGFCMKYRSAGYELYAFAFYSNTESTDLVEPKFFIHNPTPAALCGGVLIANDLAIMTTPAAFQSLISPLSGITKRSTPGREPTMLVGATTGFVTEFWEFKEIGCASFSPPQFSTPIKRGTFRNPTEDSPVFRGAQTPSEQKDSSMWFYGIDGTALEVE